MTLVLSADPGARLGWCVQTEQGLEGCGIVENASEDRGDKLLYLHEALAGMIRWDGKRVDVIVVESPMGGGNFALLASAMYVAIIVLVAKVHNIPVYLANPKQWRKAILLKGDASKEEAIAYVKAHYPPMASYDHNMCEAMLIGLMYLLYPQTCKSYTEAEYRMTKGKKKK